MEKKSTGPCKWFDLETCSVFGENHIISLFENYSDKWLFQLEKNISGDFYYRCRISLKKKTRICQLIDNIDFKGFKIFVSPKEDIGKLDIITKNTIVKKWVHLDGYKKISCEWCELEFDKEKLLLHEQECASQTIKKLKLELDNARKSIKEKDEIIKIQNDKIKNYKLQVVSKTEIIRLKENKIKNQCNLPEKLNLEAQIFDLQKSLEYEKGGKAALEKTLNSSIIKPIQKGVSDTGKRSYKSAKIESCDTNNIQPLTEKLVGDMIHEYTRDRFLRTEEGYVEFLLILFMNSTDHFDANGPMKSNYICTNNTRNSFHRFTENGTWVKDKDGLFFRKINDIVKPVLQRHWDIAGEEHKKEFYKCSSEEQCGQHAKRGEAMHTFSMDMLAGDKNPKRRANFENRIKTKLKEYIYIEAKKVAIDDDED